MAPEVVFITVNSFELIIQASRLHTSVCSSERQYFLLLNPADSERPRATFYDVDRPIRPPAAIHVRRHVDRHFPARRADGLPDSDGRVPRDRHSRHHRRLAIPESVGPGRRVPDHHVQRVRLLDGGQQHQGDPQRDDQWDCRHPAVLLPRGEHRRVPGSAYRGLPVDPRPDAQGHSPAAHPAFQRVERAGGADRRLERHPESGGSVRFCHLPTPTATRQCSGNNAVPAVRWGRPAGHGGPRPGRSGRVRAEPPGRVQRDLRPVRHAADRFGQDGQPGVHGRDQFVPRGRGRVQRPSHPTSERKNSLRQGRGSGSGWSERADEHRAKRWQDRRAGERSQERQHVLAGDLAENQSGPGRRPRGRSAGNRDRNRVGSSSVRLGGDHGCARRGGHRGHAHGHHDPGLPRKLAEHPDRRDQHPAGRVLLDHRIRRGRSDAQHHDPFGAGSGRGNSGGRRYGRDREHPPPR